MGDIALLEIQLAPSLPVPVPGATDWNEHRGGPATVLHWLETQLGLGADEPPYAHRVEEYATALALVPDATFAASFRADRWATAETLLRRREELRLAGWNEADRPALPPLVRDLARAARAGGRRVADEADRLQRVLEALERGQALPPHRCVLWDSLDRWPALWRRVLGRLAIGPATAPVPLARPSTSLGALQRGLLGGHPVPVRSDGSLRWLQSRSVHAACEAVAAALASDPASAPDTVICCERSEVALGLDGALARAGLPTMGASLRTLDHPALQVLPIVLRLCWEPVDPSLLLDFLTLPVGPIPRRAAARLAGALAEQPGLGSRAWDEAFAGLTSPEEDPDGTLGAGLGAWLGVERARWGDPVPAALVGERCRRVARWAAGRAAGLEGNEGARPGDMALTAALRLAAGQAAVLADITLAGGPALTEPQLARLLEAALAQAAIVAPHAAAWGGFRLVRSLAEITAPCARMIWIGLGTEDRAPGGWTAQEIEQLRAAGIDLDEGSAALASLRDAERRGLSRARESLLGIAIPGDEEQRPHPLWLQVKASLEAGGEKHPVALEDFLVAGTGGLEPWRFPTARTPIEPVPAGRAIWTVPASLLRDRDRTSATDLEMRLACPLKWVLTYAASLRPSAIAQLPDDFRLRGTFCHDVLAAVLGEGGTPPDPEAAVRAITEHSRLRLPRDAAPLAQPARLETQLALLQELQAAGRTLVRALRAGGYAIVGFEQEIGGRVGPRDLAGRVDCLARRPDGAEAVIDFKYAGQKHRDRLEGGRAVQLATYAAARQQATGAFPAVAYLVLSQGVLYTPAGSPLHGTGVAQVVTGPGIGEVWSGFAAAVEAAGRWLATGEIPVRPLQDAAEWPDGAQLVLDPPDGRGRPPDIQPPCEYCDFGVLCGRLELR